MSRWRGGPGLIVAAAFIGPGTVTTATLAGARYGAALLWSLVFATLATMVLQEMSARLGLATGAGLGRALRNAPGPRWLGVALAALAVSAVVVGAAAYQAGNLTGAGLGLSGAVGLVPKAWVLFAAAAAAALLWTGRYRVVERALVACVALMGVVFLLTAILVAPRVPGILAGAAVPRLPAGGALTALGLVGTTIVPYNLFLHAAAACERWQGPEDLPTARRDLVLAIGLGGLVSAAIVVTAASALGLREIRSASDMAAQLEPLLGRWAARAFTAGFAAAGLSSAITAPLAAGYATLDVLGRSRDFRAPLARMVIFGTMAVGLAVALAGTRPVPLILLAQVLNGLVLPLVALVLLVAMNDRRRLGPHVNRWRANAAGVAVAGLCLLLGIRAVVGAL